VARRDPRQREKDRNRKELKFALHRVDKNAKEERRFWNSFRSKVAQLDESNSCSDSLVGVTVCVRKFIERSAYAFEKEGNEREKGWVGRSREDGEKTRKGKKTYIPSNPLRIPIEFQHFQVLQSLLNLSLLSPLGTVQPQHIHLINTKCFEWLSEIECVPC